MLFSLKILLAATSVLTVLQGTMAHPTPIVDNDGLIDGRETDNDALLERETLVDFNLDTLADIFDDADVFERRGLPRLILGRAARNELNMMNLHGKQRKKMISWHKYELKKAMRTNPALVNNKATTAVIQHVAHIGGSNPNEKNHITASFRDNIGRNILSQFNAQKNGKTVTKDSTNHHIYTGTKGMTKLGKAEWAKNNARIANKSKGKGKGSARARARAMKNARASVAAHLKKNARRGPQRGPQRGRRK